jgi:hypothetical protein
MNSNGETPTEATETVALPRGWKFGEGLIGTTNSLPKGTKALIFSRLFCDDFFSECRLPTDDGRYGLFFPGRFWRVQRFSWRRLGAAGVGINEAF